MAALHIPKEIAATIHAGIAYVAQELNIAVGDQPPDVRATVDSCAATLEDGKHLRAFLTVVGYTMCGGTDMEAIGRVAGAVEAVHDSLLIWDDPQDGSDTRRGKPAAHKVMADRLASNGMLQGDDVRKRAIDMTNMGALALLSQAQAVLLGPGINLPIGRRAHAGHILNTHLVQTGVGQIRDLAPADYGNLNPDDILEGYRLKTGVYTMAMPPQVGALVAGASAKDLARITAWAEPAGIAYQLRDDEIGTFGDEAVTGKPAASDIAEGKPTWLVARALEEAVGPEREHILHALGSATLSGPEFRACREAIRATGALEASGRLIGQYTQSALDALAAMPKKWGKPQPGSGFLRQLVQYNMDRVS